MWGAQVQQWELQAPWQNRLFENALRQKDLHFRLARAMAKEAVLEMKARQRLSPLTKQT